MAYNRAVAFARAPVPRPADGAVRNSPPARAADPGGTLELQRMVGNRRTRALLRRPAPGAALPALTDAHPKSTLDAGAWADLVKRAQEAHAAGRTDEAVALYTRLYADLAKVAGVEALLGFSATAINLVGKEDTEQVGGVTVSAGFKPGLNLSLAGDRPGTTGYVDDQGRFGVPLDPRTPLGEGSVAIVLRRTAFQREKARSLQALRHEMLHATHHQRTLRTARAWAATRPGQRATTGDFKRWAGAHAKEQGLSDVDVLLAGEEVDRGSAATELLAYVEGFMTAFRLLDPPPKDPLDPVYAELLGVLETRKVLPWVSVGQKVRDEAIARVRAYYATLDQPHRDAFKSWVERQAAIVAEDATDTTTSTVRARARLHRTNGFADFVARLATVVAQPRR